MIGLIGMAVATPILLPALCAFHESVHCLPVSDDSFHPVHTKFVHG